MLLGIAIALLATAYSVDAHRIRYDAAWAGSGSCTVSFTPSADIENARVYYQLENFYGSHKNYIASRSFEQLRGEKLDDKSECSPIEENDDIESPLDSYNGSGELEGDATAYPWGLAAKYVFKDEFTLVEGLSTSVSIDQSDVAIYVDKHSRFDNSNNIDQQWLDMSEESFMVWMQMELFPTFK